MAAALFFGVAEAKAEPAGAMVIQTGNDLVVVVRTLIATGRYDDARQLVRQWRPQDTTYRFRVAYVDGLVLRASGDHASAIAIFRKILAERPEFTFVRKDLTETLYLAGDDEAARHNAELLVAAGVDDQMGGSLRSILQLLDDRRPFRVRGYASILPSSNLNGGTDRRIITLGGLPFVIDTASRRQSGVGVLLGGEAIYRHRLSDQTAFVGSLQGEGRFYPTVGIHNLSFNAAAGLERRFVRSAVTVSAVARQDLAGFDPSFREAGGQIDLTRQTGKSGRLFASARLTRRDYINERARDGWRTTLSAGHDRFLGPSRFVRVLGGVVVERDQSLSQSFDEFSAGVGMYSELPLGISLYAQVSYANRAYKAPMPVFGTRQDHRIDFEATLTKRDFTIGGLAPRLTYSFARNFSSSPFDDASVHGIDLRLVKDF